MLPYKNLIQIDRNNTTAIYLQIVEAFTKLIQQGKLAAGTKLPGSRALGTLLSVHRNTVTVAYEELAAQGWVEAAPKKGVFVHQKIPTIKGQELAGKDKQKSKKVGYAIRTTSFVKGAVLVPPTHLKFDDGAPDVRLAPLKALGRAYRSIIQRPSFRRGLGYGETLGGLGLRKELVKHLQATRGVTLGLDNLMISRGSIMGIYMVAKVLIKPKDLVVVGKLNYNTANMMFQEQGAELAYIDVDEQGLVIEQLESLCQKRKIRAIYVASHHHHPTTVTLSADRRLKLLDLAEQYHFAIIEDDYDYDFHYQRNPILPLASIDEWRHVIYIGSVSKVIAPAFRVGFVAAHPDLIREMGVLRRIIDRQGDFPLEKAIAELFQTGEVQRHIRKSLRIYHQRRDRLDELLQSYLGEVVRYEKPNGGMAIWTVFDGSVDLQATAQRALKKGLYFSSGESYTANIPTLKATRLGFASMTVDELEEAVLLLKKSIVLV
jgi:GntR family transcriptional regulator/MocR family aminotransferase